MDKVGIAVERQSDWWCTGLRWVIGSGPLIERLICLARPLWLSEQASFQAEMVFEASMYLDVAHPHMGCINHALVAKHCLACVGNEIVQQKTRILHLSGLAMRFDGLSQRKWLEG